MNLGVKLRISRYKSIVCFIGSQRQILTEEAKQFKCSYNDVFLISLSLDFIEILYTVFIGTVWAVPKSVSIYRVTKSGVSQKSLQIKIFFLFATFSGLLRFALSFLASLLGSLSFGEE